MRAIEERPTIDHKTTRINGGFDTPLDIEYNVHLGGRRQTDDTFKVRYWQEVTLAIPKSAYHEKARLLNMSPQTALSLLDWLTQEKTTLQKLAQEAQ